MTFAGPPQDTSLMNCIYEDLKNSGRLEKSRVLKWLFNTQAHRERLRETVYAARYLFKQGVERLPLDEQTDITIQIRNNPNHGPGLASYECIRVNLEKRDSRESTEVMFYDDNQMYGRIDQKGSWIESLMVAREKSTS